MGKKRQAIPKIKYAKLLLSDEAIRNVELFIKHLKRVTKSELSPSLKSEIYFGNDEEGYISLDGNEARRYTKTLSFMLKDLCSSELLSYSTVEILLQKAILESIDFMKKRKKTSFKFRLTKSINNIKSDLLKMYKEFYIAYPICGLSNEGLPIKIGDIEFLIFDLHYLEQYYLHPNQQKTSNLKLYAERIISDAKEMGYWEKPIASLKVGAYDISAARNEAVKEIRATLEILNFYSDLLPYFKGYLFLPGEANQTYVITLAINTENYTSKVERTLVQPFENYSIKKLLADDNKYNLGVRKVFSLLGKARTGYQERLLSSIRWAGKATVLAYQGRREDAFLLYAIALESMILPEFDSEISYRFRLRLSHLMFEKAKYRREYSNKISDIYNNRSSIVHNGNFEISNHQLTNIRWITKNCFVKLLKVAPFNKITEDKEFLDWLEDKVYA
jgi:hypothetical protein